MAGDADNPLMKVASAKLSRMMGPEKGLELLTQTLGDAGLRSIESADDLRKFAERLVSREQGLLRMIGHSLRTEALLRGARLGE